MNGADGGTVDRSANTLDERNSGAAERAQQCLPHLFCGSTRDGVADSPHSGVLRFGGGRERGRLDVLLHLGGRDIVRAQAGELGLEVVEQRGGRLVRGPSAGAVVLARGCGVVLPHGAGWGGLAELGSAVWPWRLCTGPAGGARHAPAEHFGRRQASGAWRRWWRSGRRSSGGCSGRLDMLAGRVKRNSRVKAARRWWPCVAAEEQPLLMAGGGAAATSNDRHTRPPALQRPGCTASERSLQPRRAAAAAPRVPCARIGPRERCAPHSRLVRRCTVAPAAGCRG